MLLQVSATLRGVLRLQHILIRPCQGTSGDLGGPQGSEKHHESLGSSASRMIGVML